MIKHDDKWGTICDDGFHAIDAQAACHSLGFKTGSFRGQNSKFNSTIPLWLENIACSSSTSNFLECSHNGWGNHDCSHGEDVYLTCR